MGIFSIVKVLNQLTQYTEGSSSASIKGNAMMFENNVGSNELGVVSQDDPLPITFVGTMTTAIASIDANTNTIGKLLPPDIDITTHTKYTKQYYTNAGAVTDGIVWSPNPGARWHVVSMTISVSLASTVTLEDDNSGGDQVIWKAELAANSVTSIYFGDKYPLASGQDTADLLVTSTAGNVYITCVGYET